MSTVTADLEIRHASASKSARADDVTGVKLPRVCIVSHEAFNALADAGRGHIGGVEHQTSLLAKWLAAHGFDVSMITWDNPSDKRTVIAGVKVLRIRHSGGLPGIRFFHPHWTNLNRALAVADADVYYQNGAECVTGQVALWCRRHGRSFVFSAAADADVEQKLPAMSAWHERTLYRSGLRAATSIIVQNDKQRKLLANGFGLTASILPMPCPDMAGADFQLRTAPHTHPRVLWVGRISPVKRLEWLIEVARRTPNVHFDVVGPADERHRTSVLENARRVANITIHGRKGRDELARLYRDGDCLLCTSIREGFPNTFLEAWSHGLPVVSTLDVDSKIRDLNLGAIATDTDGLSLAILRVIGSSSNWATISRNARNYFQQQHSVDIAMPRFAECLKHAAAQKKS